MITEKQIQQEYRKLGVEVEVDADELKVTNILAARKAQAFAEWAAKGGWVYFYKGNYWYNIIDNTLDNLKTARLYQEFLKAMKHKVVSH